eukprot:GILK01018364.1.p2 GENE.GILK01018364.1~~GILK01018364.1.p2  ORF type:complete len:226 (+),score=4.44 GILK01018364.1:896-1573(+)
MSNAQLLNVGGAPGCPSPLAAAANAALMARDRWAAEGPVLWLSEKAKGELEAAVGFGVALALVYSRGESDCSCIIGWRWSLRCDRCPSTGPLPRPLILNDRELPLGDKLRCIDSSLLSTALSLPSSLIPSCRYSRSHSCSTRKQAADERKEAMQKTIRATAKPDSNPLSGAATFATATAPMVALCMAWKMFSMGIRWHLTTRRNAAWRKQRAAATDKMDSHQAAP